MQKTNLWINSEKDASNENAYETFVQFAVNTFFSLEKTAKSCLNKFLRIDRVFIDFLFQFRCPTSRVQELFGKRQMIIVSIGEPSNQRVLKWWPGEGNCQHMNKQEGLSE